MPTTARPRPRFATLGRLTAVAKALATGVSRTALVRARTYVNQTLTTSNSINSGY